MIAPIHCIRPFEGCTRPIPGVPCCLMTIDCTDNTVFKEVFCDDSCEQSCEHVQQAADCHAYGCEWFDSQDACVEATERVRTATGCIPYRQGSCDPEDEASCPAGQVCTGFAFNPCADADCETCGDVEWRCSRPLLAP